VIVVARGAKKAAPRLDAQIRVGGDAGASEVVVLRLYGALANEGASCVVPMLLPDAPVVGVVAVRGARLSGKDPIGRLATRRITDAASERNPTRALEARAKAYANGTPTSRWTRLTLWRAVLASALDLPPYEKVTGATVSGEGGLAVGRPAGRLARGAAAATGSAAEGQERARDRAGRVGAPLRQHRAAPSGCTVASSSSQVSRERRVALQRAAGARLHRRGTAPPRPGRDLRVRPEGAGQDRPRRAPEHTVGQRQGTGEGRSEAGGESFRESSVERSGKAKATS